MGVFQEMLLAARIHLRPMVLIASLPHNDPELAQAALDGGADMIKVHINLSHHASGTRFGTLAEESPAIERIVHIWEGKPVGIVPGAKPELNDRTMAALPGLGIKFVSLYLHHASAGALPPFEKIDRMLALGFEDGPEIAESLDCLPIQACELSILHPDTYGQPLTYHDIARYAAAARRTKLPLVVPTQHRIPPESTADLLNIGVSAVMIGSIVAGDTPNEWLQTTSAFRKAMDENWK